MKPLIYLGLLCSICISSMAFIACQNKPKQHLKGELESNNVDASKAPFNKLVLIGNLDSKIKETSGLALLGKNLITHNDKGRSNQIMLIDAENGSLQQTITLTNATNNDWEDLASNKDFLFIGDMGNNDGERKNLAIYVIAIKDINKNSTAVKSIATINFHYPEQKEFGVAKKHNFDCEAILSFNNQIYLFTKNRLDDRTNLYSLPTEAGNYAAKFIASFETGGRITGADISNDGKKVALVGYNKKSDCFTWTFDDFIGDNFFTGKAKQYILGPYEKLGQMEGIAFKDNTSVYISSEEIVNVLPSLYLFRLD